MREKMPSHRAMSALDAHVEVYGPAVNDLTSLWIKIALSELMDLSDTSLQVNGLLVHFTLYFITVSPSL